MSLHVPPNLMTTCCLAVWHHNKWGHESQTGAHKEAGQRCSLVDWTRLLAHMTGCGDVAYKRMYEQGNKSVWLT